MDRLGLLCGAIGAATGTVGTSARYFSAKVHESSAVETATPKRIRKEKKKKEKNRLSNMPSKTRSGSAPCTHH